MSQKKIINRFILISFILGIFFLLLHSMPTLSIRSSLFFSGHFITAFKGEIVLNEEQQNIDKSTLEKNNEKIYTILDNDAKFFRTGNPIVNYKVKKISFIYFADAYGEL